MEDELMQILSHPGAEARLDMKRLRATGQQLENLKCLTSTLEARLADGIENAATAVFDAVKGVLK